MTFLGPILDEIAAERVAQDAKWGEQNHPIGHGPEQTYAWANGVDEHGLAGCFTMAELAYHAKLDCDYLAKRGEVTWFDILLEEFFEVFAEEGPAEQRAELVQVAAVAVAMIEYLDRTNG